MAYISCNQDKDKQQNQTLAKELLGVLPNLDKTKRVEKVGSPEFEKPLSERNLNFLKMCELYNILTKLCNTSDFKVDQFCAIIIY